MTAPTSYTHSPFQYHHVPNSPFLLPPKPQGTYSPAPLVPDIDYQRDSRHTTGGLRYNGKVQKWISFKIMVPFKITNVLSLGMESGFTQLF